MNTNSRPPAFSPPNVILDKTRLSRCELGVGQSQHGPLFLFFIFIFSPCFCLLRVSEECRSLCVLGFANYSAHCPPGLSSRISSPAWAALYGRLRNRRRVTVNPAGDSAPPVARAPGAWASTAPRLPNGPLRKPISSHGSWRNFNPSFRRRLCPASRVNQPRGGFLTLPLNRAWVRS